MSILQDIILNPVTLIALGGGFVSLVQTIYTKRKHASASAEAERSKNKVSNDFVKDMATNHLPHIYNGMTQQSAALIKIGAALGVEVDIGLDNPPPIRFQPYEES